MSTSRNTSTKDDAGEARCSVRIGRAIFDRASEAAKRNRRSVPKQLEYWAEIGRAIAAELSPRAVDALLSQNASVSIVPLDGLPRSTDDVEARIAVLREKGVLASAVTGANVAYQLDSGGHLVAVKTPHAAPDDQAQHVDENWPPGTQSKAGG